MLGPTAGPIPGRGRNVARRNRAPKATGVKYITLEHRVHRNWIVIDVTVTQPGSEVQGHQSPGTAVEDACRRKVVRYGKHYDMAGVEFYPFALAILDGMRRKLRC